MNTVGRIVRSLAWPQAPGAFRLWLALLVVIHHLTHIEIGKAPVLVFFFLSGFWVERVWTTRYAHTRSAWLTFVVSRWWRIAPILALVSPLAIAALLISHGGEAALIRQMPWRHVLGAFSVLGYAQLPIRPVGPGWSLDIEMQFYLVAPLLAVLVRACSPLLVCLFGFVLFALGALWGGVTLPTFLPWFLAGMLAAHHDWKPAAGLARASFGVTVGLTLAVLVSPLAARFIVPGAPQYTGFNLALSVLILPFALWTVQRPRAAKPDRLDGALADQSYLIYLLHWPALLMLFHLFPARGGAGYWSAVPFAALVVTGVSILVWRWIDRPLNRRRRAWVDGRMGAADGASQPATKRDDSAPVFA